MPTRRFSALPLSLSLLALAVPGHAATAPAKAASQPRSADILVQGRLEKPSRWKRAESEHVVVTSDGSEAELRRVSRNLELLYQLLSRLYRRGGGRDDTVKLQVTLSGSADFLHAIGADGAAAEKSYLPAFFDPTYYEPGENGEVLAIVRSDQAANLNTMRAYKKDCDDILDAGGDDCNPIHLPYHDPAITTWEQLLYARFAQHFLLTYQPAPYPRWYLDGIGSLFSNIAIGRDGSIDYGRAPAQYRQIFRSYGELDLESVLTGRYLALPPDQRDWSPAHAWLLTHYFLFAAAKPERSCQFQQYMAAIRQGVPMAEAAKLFGNLKQLQRQIRWKVDSDIVYSHAKPPQKPVEEPLVTALSPARAALIQARLELGALPADGAAKAVDPDWLVQARRAAERGGDAETILFAAEAECRSGHADACLADAERVLAAAPDNVDALAWKGVALTDRAIAGPAATRADTLAAARGAIEQAIRIDNDATLPLIAYFQSFTKAGERVPDPAMLGMAKVISRIPAAPAPRLYLGQELARQGKTELAHRVLYTVLQSPYDSPEKRAALALFPSGTQPGG